MLLTPPITTTKAYLQQLRLPGTLYPAIKKIIRNIKRLKTHTHTHFEETEQDQNQTWQEGWNYQSVNLK